MATLTISGAVILKAGVGASGKISAGTLLGQNQTSGLAVEDWIEQAEAHIGAATRKDWIAAYSGLSANVKLILDEVCSDLAAIYAIQYDMSNYTSRVEAEDQVNILRDAALRGMAILRDLKTQDFMDGV